MAEMELYQYVGSWSILINPVTVIVGLYFAVLHDAHRDSDFTLYLIISVIIANLIYGILAAYITIRIVDWCKSK